MLTVNITPKSLQHWNLRRVITKREWTEISGEVRRRASWTCEGCRRTLAQREIVCHEEWRFYDGFLQLESMMALCRACHEIKHGNFGEKRLLRLRIINHWTDEELTDHVSTARVFGEMRNHAGNWKVDTKQILAKAREYLPRKREVFGSFRRGMSKTL